MHSELVQGICPLVTAPPYLFDAHGRRSGDIRSEAVAAVSGTLDATVSFLPEFADEQIDQNSHLPRRMLSRRTNDEYADRG
jgi:hypothetical protein